MLSRRTFLLTSAASSAALIAGSLSWCNATGATPVAAASTVYEVMHSDAEWKKLLTDQQFDVLRRAGTERPYSSPLNSEHRRGTFSCAGCQLPLFSSSTKFDSHTGWPSFWKPLARAVNDKTDSTLGMERTEVLCRRCGGHLGHVFDDGPAPTGLRYCMNGVAMNFSPGAA
ncbi:MULTISPECIES: peptide-methionine (R)-S-oxide reductase MsrB [unclassified Janthinobacterium]|uniref:peptide-methionine (R)-S-oxide reductase MsrB n=1 Tax=unclassified Janthinobacterium TaxID=2610881 RepID=UPI00161237DF|nr:MULTISPECIES: peptide-methionine (R)-S-oxide reductase MsrB [unclassified Janthinobacterium]MBB5368212.1 peptide-methionine (R)-S-oxide reductase [Janthinobacterium sp. K2C7]MBB5382251.1 peptide-methionine (R)-S-oxide reductase [Janthinobacterium sp. K2Li3]MBB5386594.1 peptide-methionine (R)-S-oxide reductase [Janthinobacterium sp. K2E3]